jgi:hypothetical protein
VPGGFFKILNGAAPGLRLFSNQNQEVIMHRATSVYEPIPIENSSSHHRHYAVHGGGEAHSLSASDVQADREVLLARTEIAEAYYRGGDSLALELLASSSIRLYSRVLASELSAVDLFDDLQECAANLGVAGRCQDGVQAAIAYGPTAYGAA